MWAGRGEVARPGRPLESPRDGGRTQESLYAEIDLELSWSEDELPQVERTKHVHSLHPYLGKFVPQLVEVFLNRYFSPGGCIYDPFVGSGTTLVEANVFGADAVGCDISAFNCCSAGQDCPVRVGRARARPAGDVGGCPAPRRRPADRATPWLTRWYAPRALADSLPTALRPNACSPLRRCRQGHSVAGRPLRSPDEALRSRFPAHTDDGAYHA